MSTSRIAVAPGRVELSEEKRALLERRLRGDESGDAGSYRIPRRQNSGPVPLSFAQQRLWFLDQLVPDNPFYNEHSAIPLPFAVHVGALEATINEIVRRHEALRTSFRLENGEPRQVVSAFLHVPLRVIDLRWRSPEDAEAEFERTAREDAKTPFQLGRAPLIRTTLVQRAADDFVFLLTMHHIVCDGWSMDVFWRELTEIYTAFSTGQSHTLPPLTVQYPDFAEWQRSYLSGERLDSLIGYWKTQLADITPLNLPCDYPRPAIQSFRGEQQFFWIPRALVDRLQSIGNNERSTLFMVLLAAWQVFLQRYTGQDDITVGSPIANRNHVELEGLIGFFVNSLVMRTDLSGDPTFREAVRRVREVSLGAFAHQDLPFERLVEELHPERDLSRNPLFQATFQVWSSPLGEDTSGQLSPETLPSEAIEVGTAKFDLRLDLTEGRDGLVGIVEYSLDLFEPTSIRRMIGHFQRLLAGIAANPDRRVSMMPILNESERKQILIDWNRTRAPFPDTAHPFELIARQDPQRVAVSDRGETLTFGELIEKSGAIAGMLIQRGVRQGDVVGVLMNRSAGMIAAFLGAWRAGAAYLPLDPVYPDERLRYMLRDSGVRVVMTESALDSRLSRADVSTIALDKPLEPHEPESRPLADLVYAIYTSGSTGLPKAVAVRRRSLMNLIAWNNAAYSVGPDDRVTQISSPSFDACVWELWPHLCAGASIHIVPDHFRSSPRELLDWMAEERISLSFIPTPVAEKIIDLPPPAGLKLRVLLTGGDVLHRAPAMPLPYRLVNHYGPTENTVVATCIDVHSPGPADELPPIGRPITNVRTYVLDRWYSPTPLGVPGELFIGGDSLADGYLGKPELTAERFPMVHLPETGSMRLYRTGDLVRFRRDGALEFLGRLDNQVKIRGYRIELGEIEAVLRQSPGVREAICIVREDMPGERRLAAYVTEKDGAKLSRLELRAALQQQLPEYMIPAAIMILPELPLTANGKIDRAALPPPAAAEANRTEIVRPASEAEHAIAAIWSRILGANEIGVDDNFFEIGGHSLLLVKLQGELGSLFEKSIPIVDLFRNPTIRTQAQTLENCTATPVPTGNDIQARAEKQRQSLARAGRAHRKGSDL